MEHSQRGLNIMYKMMIRFIENEGYRISKEYQTNGSTQVLEVLTKLSKSEVNELLTKNNLYTPYYKGSEIGFMW